MSWKEVYNIIEKKFKDYLSDVYLEGAYLEALTEEELQEEFNFNPEFKESYIAMQMTLTALAQKIFDEEGAGYEV
jgi:hypothetical protein